MTHFAEGSPGHAARICRARAREVLKDAIEANRVEFGFLERRTLTRYWDATGMRYSGIKAIADEALRIHRGEPFEIPMLSDPHVEKLVKTTLGVIPHTSEAKLRAEVGRHGRYDRSTTAFGRLVAKVRSELGITVRRGNYPRRSA